LAKLRKCLYIASEAINQPDTTMIKKSKPYRTGLKCTEIKIVQSLQNIFVKHDDPQLLPGDLSAYSVRLHFHLWAIDKIAITGISFKYLNFNHLLSDASVKINGENKELDGNYNIQHPLVLNCDDVIDIQLWRRWSCPVEKLENMDYKEFIITIGLTTRRSWGFQNLTVRGNLLPGGRAKLLSVEISDDQQND